jgi:hypothetical protein
MRQPRFRETVPPGHRRPATTLRWAGGRSGSAAHGVVSCIGSKGHRLANVHRVLNKDGQTSPAWTPAGEGMPATASDVEGVLSQDGVRITAGRACATIERVAVERASSGRSGIP